MEHRGERVYSSLLCQLPSSPPPPVCLPLGDGCAGGLDFPRRLLITAVRLAEAYLGRADETSDAYRSGRVGRSGVGQSGVARLMIPHHATTGEVTDVVARAA